MARLTNTEIEERWYDLFCGWKKSDRAAAIKALTQLHPRLPDNPKPWLITEEIIDQAIAAAEAGHINGLTYNQSSWCGTACCVLGFARHIAGLPSRGTGPLDEEFAKSRRITTLRSLMRCPSPAILAIMRKVGTDGKIDLSGAVLRGADLRRADLLGADLLNADLRGANLSCAVLRGAVLLDAVLRGANLSDANLSGAVRWDGAKYVPVTPEWLKERGAIL